MHYKIIKKGLILIMIIIFLTASILPIINADFLTKKIASYKILKNENEHQIQTSFDSIYKNIYEYDNILGAEILPVNKKDKQSFSSVPLFFTENYGQFPDEVLYRAQVSDMTFYFCKNKIVTVFTDRIDKNFDEQSVDFQNNRFLNINPETKLSKSRKFSVTLEFVDINPDVTIYGEKQLSNYNNYFIGNNPTKWYTYVPNYEMIIYKDIYPGINLIYYGSDSNSLKYDFIIQPEADISDIQIRYIGINGLNIDPKGNLLVQKENVIIYENTPFIYQIVNDKICEINGGYCLHGFDMFGFNIQGYDNSLPLVIDPELIYSTYIGGSNNEAGTDITVDTQGYTYITGPTQSNDFPTTPDTYDNTYNDYDLFVTKFSPNGDSLIYSTYIGGSGIDNSWSIIVEPQGHVYITGQTDSSDFPTTNDTIDSTFNGDIDGFIVKLNPNGASLEFSTYLGGSNFENARCVSVDYTGYIYITGQTDSSDYPVTNGAYDTSYNGLGDVFVTKINPTGTNIIYSTYLGNNNDDFGFNAVINNQGYIYITGWTKSIDFPITQNAYDKTHNGLMDIFLTELNPTGNNIVYSTFIGGNNIDYGYDIEIDNNGYCYITGQTYSLDFPTTPDSNDTSYNGLGDAFIIKLNPVNNNLVYSTYIGGYSPDCGYSIVLDINGSAYITGYTESIGFPITQSAFDKSYNGERDVFVTKINFTIKNLVYSTYIGGTKMDNSWSITIDTQGYTYITGVTESSNFPTTLSSYDTIYNNLQDVFVTKLNYIGLPPSIPTITGPTKIKPNQIEEFTFTSTDPDGDKIFYYIDWDDEDIIDWEGPFTSGEPFIPLHKWSDEDIFTIKCKAKDTNGLESDYGTLDISTPKNKTIYILFFRLIFNYPNHYHLLQNIINNLGK